MEKLSEEMFEKLEQVIADTISSERMAAKIMRGLDEAGIFAPTDTPYEKARRLWEELYAPYDACLVKSIKDDVIDPLLAEIDRRDREAWSDQDMISFGSFCCGKALNGEDVDMKEELAARRAAKAKE